jgi:medium-chain acyl-[acyl-carrier-protein] hydrolase
MYHADPAGPWIFRKARPAARLRLFCFPYAGGATSAFRGWADAMPSLEVCTIHAPGRETRRREPALLRMEPLVEGIVTAIRPLLDRPFALYGHSLGAFVAFEVARALRREGAPAPSRLFASGCRAPAIHAVDDPIHVRPDAEFIDRIRRYQGTPAEVLNNVELMELVLPALRADFAVFETYRRSPEPPLDVPISALGGLDDDRATRDELEGWRGETTADFALRMFPGHHFFIHAARTALLGAVLTDLARAG